MTSQVHQQQEDSPFLQQKQPIYEIRVIHLTTGSPFSNPSGSLPPGEVSPLHIIFAPERTNLIAPLST